MKFFIYIEATSRCLLFVDASSDLGSQYITSLSDIIASTIDSRSEINRGFNINRFVFRVGEGAINSYILQFDFSYSVDKGAELKKPYQIGDFRTIILFEPDWADKTEEKA